MSSSSLKIKFFGLVDDFGAEKADYFFRTAMVWTALFSLRYFLS